MPREHLQIKVGADTTKLNAALNRSAKMVDRWSGGIKNRLVGTFGSAALGYGAMRFVSRTVEYVAQMNTLAKRTGIAVEEMQKFDRAARLSNVSLEEMIRTINKLDYKRGQAIANPNSTAARGFAGFGIDPLTTDKMQTLSAVGSALKTQGYENVALYMNDLFEETSQNMIEVFELLADDSIKNMQVVSSETADELERLSDAIKEIGHDIQIAFVGPMMTFIDFVRASLQGIAEMVYNTRPVDWLQMLNPIDFGTEGGKKIHKAFMAGMEDYLAETIEKRKKKKPKTRGRIPSPGDPDFIGPQWQAPSPGDPDFIGPVRPLGWEPAKKSLSNIYSDNLTSVGNFLGAGNVQSAVLTVAQRQLKVQQDMDMTLRRLLDEAKSGGLFV